MQEFMLLIYNRADHQDRWTQDEHRHFLMHCERYIERLKQQGQLKAAQPLAREGVVLFRSKDEWKESPVDRMHEMQVGYYHVLAKDISEAVAIAKENPEFTFSTTASVEIRPVKTIEDTTNYQYPA
ncbi:MAG TPA: YciI family protein [Moraxellaceae bacterium]|nr:YciI family protein [Moraxellaceae bacterium]